jgi:ATP-dependent Lon protease
MSCAVVGPPADRRRNNERDLDDIPESLRRELEFVPVDTIAKVIERALDPARAI